MTTRPAGGSPGTGDWRVWPAHRIAALFDAERAHWARAYRWDQTWTFSELNAARQRGVLPGWIITGPDGGVRAWTFFLRYGPMLQIGHVTSDDAAATAALIDGVLASPEASGVTGTVLFSPDAPGLTEVLAARAFRVEPYDYLMRPSRPGDTAPLSLLPGRRALTPADVPDVAALFGVAYGDTTFDRPFVPGGEPEEWRRYVAQLVDTRGCGDFLPLASAVVTDGAEPAACAAALIGTQLSERTGHIAQIAVAPHARGRGLAERLLSGAFHAFAAAGLDTATLLVARHNAAARRLYDRIGFAPAGTFISGTRKR